MSVPDFVAIHPTVVKIFLAWSKKVDHFNVSTTNNSKPFQSVSVWLNWLCWLTRQQNTDTVMKLFSAVLC